MAPLGSTILSLTTGSALGFDLGLVAGSNDSIVVDATSVIGSSVKLNLNGLGAVSAGSYTLLSAAGGLNLTNWILGSAPAGLNYKFDTTSSGGTALMLNASPIINLYFNGVTGASWNTAGSWSTDLAGTTAAIEQHGTLANAVARGFEIARPGDAVLIAGKGHEDYQIIGETKHSFDDRLEAESALRMRACK